MAYQHILVETEGPVGVVTFNRPDALNALNSMLMSELSEALAEFEADAAIGAIVITGSEKAFAAGADIKEMQNKTFTGAYLEDFITGNWEGIERCRKPVIAAVAGYALGGGCEIAMMCDIIIAAENAKFGQPEVTLGIIPGIGGTQRLTKLIGRTKAMELCLTGRTMDAEEAERAGLVSRVVPTEQLRGEAIGTAEQIASQSRPAVMMAKEAIKYAEEAGLKDGIRYERRLFHSTFATADQKENRTAFVEKRKPAFTDK